jgi:hypothetical protein
MALLCDLTGPGWLVTLSKRIGLTTLWVQTTLLYRVDDCKHYVSFHGTVGLDKGVFVLVLVVDSVVRGWVVADYDLSVDQYGHVSDHGDVVYTAECTASQRPLLTASMAPRYFDCEEIL